MGRGKQTWGWPSTSNTWEANHAKKAKDKGKGKGTAQDANAFPSYDATGSSGASGSQPQPSSSTSTEDGELKKALTEIFQKNNMEIPTELQSYFKPKIGEMLQSDQKLLNTKRKLVAKLDRLNKAVIKKQEQWQTFRITMKEHLAKEQTRFETDMEEIKAAIQETQCSLDKLLQGGVKDQDMEEDLKETSIEEMLNAETNEQKDKTHIQANTDIAIEELRQAKMGQLHLSQQVQELQQQLLYVTAAMKPPIAGSPSRDAFQNPFTPIKHRQQANGKGPYAKTEPTEIQAQQTDSQKPIDIEEISD